MRPVWLARVGYAHMKRTGRYFVLSPSQADEILRAIAAAEGHGPVVWAVSA